METVEQLGGRYRLRARLASGGMGDVWAADDELLGRPVALKVLRADLGRDDSFRQRFRVEAQAAARLSHPGIVGVYDYGEEDGTAFLVMELVDGDPLNAVLARRGRLSPAETMSVVAQTAAALAAAHEEGLIHRDIKPANLLVRPDGRVKVTDFGIVRAADARTVTDAGQVLGTVAYMSPEQVRGQRVTAATDLYSLGVVAYECLAGRRPFAADESIAVALAHVTDPVPELPGEVGAATRDLVHRLMAKDPAARPGSAAAVAALAGRLAVATGPGAGPPWGTGAAGDVGPAPGDLGDEGAGGPATAPWRPAFALTGEGTGSAGARVAATWPTAAVPVPRAGAAQPWGRGAVRWPAGFDGPWPRAVLLGAVAFLVAIVALLATTASAGAVQVPSVRGQPVGVATARLERAGLHPVTGTEDVPGAKAGTVVGEHPRAGAAVAPGGTVHLVVASGYVAVAPGSLDGLTAATAQRRLTRLGLVAVTTQAASGAVASGKVVSFSPSGRLRTGTTVTLVVSTGAPPPTTTTTAAPQVTVTTQPSANPGPVGGPGGGGPGGGGGGDGGGPGGGDGGGPGGGHGHGPGGGGPGGH